MKNAIINRDKYVMNRNVAIYVRVSSDSQDVSLSIGAQLRTLREYAVRNGYTVVREFVDEAESGRTSARPAFREMIALAKTKSPPFSIILVWKLNRFARSRMDSITYKELLRKRGINVLSINEPIEDNPSGRLLEGIIESVDEFYSANLGEDIKRGLRESALRGFFVGSRPPFGYRKIAVNDGDKTRYKLEPDVNSPSVNIIKRIFTLALGDSGTKQIAMILNRDGLRTSTGARWTRTYVHKILTNEVYYGTLVLGGRTGHPAIENGESPVRIENAWPAIVEIQTFKAVQQKMASKAPVQVHPRVVPSFYLLSGLLRCSCGQSMVGRSAKSHRYYYYMCNRSHKQGSEACGARELPKAKIEASVTEQIKTRILSEEVLEKLVMLTNYDIDSRHRIYSEKLDTLNHEINDINLRLSKLYDALETGKLSLDVLAPRINELKTRQDESTKARLVAEADLEVRGASHADLEEVKSYAGDMLALLDDADLIRSKAFLRTFIDKIVIDGDKGTIYYKLPVPARWPEKEDIEVLPIVPFGGDLNLIVEEI